MLPTHSPGWLAAHIETTGFYAGGFSFCLHTTFSQTSRGFPARRRLLAVEVG